MSCAGTTTHKLVIRRKDGVVVYREWVRLEDGLVEADPAVIARLNELVDDEADCCPDAPLPVAIRTDVAGVIPANTSFSITPISGQNPWVFQGSEITSTRTIHGKSGCCCFPDGIAYDPGEGELLIVYIPCEDACCDAEIKFEVHSSEALLIVCNVAVSNVVWDCETCTLTVSGSGAENLEYSIDGVSWFTDPNFFTCLDEGETVAVQVRNADDIVCVSDPFFFTMTDKIMAFIGDKNDLAGGLGEDKEAAVLGQIQGNYCIHYVEEGVIKDGISETDFLNAHPCVKYIYVTPEAKDVRDNLTFAQWDIPIILSGHKDIFKDLGGGFGTDLGNEDDSSPKDNITVVNNTDPTGVLNGFPLGQVQFSNEGKKLAWVDPTGTDIVTLANLDGDPAMAVVWYVPPGGNYGGGTATNYIFGLPFHPDHPKDLTADGLAIIQQVIDAAYAQRSACA